MSLKDDLIRHQVFLQRIVPDIINKTSASVKRAKYLINTKVDSTAVRQLINAVNKSIDLLPSKLEALALYEEKFNRKLLKKIGVSATKITNNALLDDLSNSVIKMSIGGQVSGVSKVLLDFKAIQQKRINQIILDNMTQAKTKEELSKTLTEYLSGRYTSQYRALTNTLVNNAASAARLAVLQEANVTSVIWCSELDDAVCEECSGLDGQEFSLDEFESLCPAHANCRCFAEPVLNNNDGVV